MVVLFLPFKVYTGIHYSKSVLRPYVGCQISRKGPLFSGRVGQKDKLWSGYNEESSTRTL